MEEQKSTNSEANKPEGSSYFELFYQLDQEEDKDSLSKDGHCEEVSSADLDDTETVQDLQGDT
jgi:hypothetical protein